MSIRNNFALLLIGLLAAYMTLCGIPSFAESEDASHSTTSEPAPSPNQTPEQTEPAKQAPPEQSTEAMEDACLPSLYRDWREFGLEGYENGTRRKFADIIVVIDRSLFGLTIQGVNRDESTEEIYRTPVGLGDPWSETPRGRYYINHLYCYPDVVYFDGASNPIPDIYNGLFAPLLLCDGSGRCDRFRDLGIHGFHASAHPDPASISPETEGPVSGGCIRLPDPCRFKRELVGLVGVGPLKKNERGSYHWLNRPVEVLITGDYPSSMSGITLMDILRGGLQQVREGVQDLIDAVSR